MEPLSVSKGEGKGVKFNICRVPICASDYAISRYTLDETEDDFDMEDFSIERDKEYLIPYIKAALKYKPDLKIWGSVWTPPTWMKTNGAFDSREMKDDDQVYEAFALYLARFVEEYKTENIDIYIRLRYKMNQRSKQIIQAASGHRSSFWFSSGIIWGLFLKKETWKRK